MGNYIIAGVGVATAFTRGSNPRLIVTSTTLQEQSLSLSATAEEIRGGLANSLLFRYFHDSLLESTLTDSVFDLNYIALNVGGTISAGANAIEQEQVTVGANGAISVNGTPTEFGTSGVKYGWVKKVDGSAWETVVFTGQSAPTSFSENEVVCAKYVVAKTDMQHFIVPSAIIPETVHMYMTYPLFAGGVTDDISSKTQIGELIVDIPKFQFNGTFDMSLTSSGAATSNISGQALATYGGTSCDDLGQYADIRLNLFDTTWYDTLEGLYVDDAEIALSTGGSKTLSVYGVYKGGAVGKIDNSLLTFSSDTTAKVTVGAHTGAVSAVSAGTAHIEIKPTAISGKPTPPSVAGYAEVTVS